ncbi:MAG: phage replisome organizer N-terminal domain-containing protein [Clostridiales bacterium]|nr:phage replisome organizer N-terminal domain-containing protein [Clostridiales bacterium]
MSENRKYYFLKLKDTFFENDSIVLLQALPDGYLYTDLLLKLYLKSLKNNGKLQVNENFPYTLEVIAKLTGHKVELVESALKIFQGLGLVEPCADGTLYMTNIELMVGKSSGEADRKREARSKNKGLEIEKE